MNAPERILDLGCGVGGASTGYHLAWPDAEIIGVDIKKQPRYPFTFIQDDALTIDLDGYDFIHASMPCTRWAARQMNMNHPDLITPLRERLYRARTAQNKPVHWVMENVAQAPLRHDLQLCGTALGLTNRLYELRRHRYFEFFPEPLFMDSPKCKHTEKETVSIWGRSVKYNGYEEVAQELMEMPWAKWADFKESIPPKYTLWISFALMMEP